MKESRSAEIRYIIDRLEEQGYLIAVDLPNSILRVTEMSYPILRGSAKVYIKKTKQIKAREDTAFSGDPALMKKLKELRTYFAMRCARICDLFGRNAAGYVPRDADR